MWKMVLYVLGTVGIFYLAVLFRIKGLFVVCGALVLLPLFFLCLLFYVKHKLKTELIFLSYPMEHTGNYQAGLRVENPTGFWLPRVQAKIQVKNMATGKSKWLKVSGRISSEDITELVGTIKKPEFGMWQAECKYIRCFEWTNFWFLPLKEKEQKQVMVFPAVYETNIKVGIRTRLFLSDGEQYHPQLSGDDPSETLKLREYQKGDRMNRIHWKISAKNDNLIVAELGMPMGCNIVIFLDVEPSALKKEEQRTYWEVIHSITQELLEQECAFYLVWKDKKYEDTLCRKAIRKVEDLLDFWCEISPLNMKKGVDSRAYAETFPGEMYATRLVLNQDLELICNDKLTEKIKPGQAKKQLTELELSL